MIDSSDSSVSISIIIWPTKASNRLLAGYWVWWDVAANEIASLRIHFLPWPSRGGKLAPLQLLVVVSMSWLGGLTVGPDWWRAVQAAGEQSCYLGQGPQSTPGRHGAPLLRHRPAPDILHSRGRTFLTSNTVTTSPTLPSTFQSSWEMRSHGKLS